MSKFKTGKKFSIETRIKMSIAQNNRQEKELDLILKE